jgi:transcriptional regulator with XRE-family HTH domain
MFNMENFGDWLLNTLRDRKMSQSELARRAGISKGTVSNLINGTSGIGQDSLIAISRALNLDRSTVFRAAGLLLPTSDDPWVDEMEHKISQLTGIRRKLAESLLNSLLDEQERDASSPSQTKPALK